jgi:hypothetical protein
MKNLKYSFCLVAILLVVFTLPLASATPWNISEAYYVGQESPAFPAGTPQDIFFKLDGTRAYVIDSIQDEVRQFSLSSAWNVSTATYVDDFSVGAGPQGIYIKSDGTHMYIVLDTGDAIRDYELSVPWNITSGVLVGTTGVGESDTEPEGIHFKNDGTVMYIIGNANNKIYSYLLSSPWNITTAGASPFASNVTAPSVSPLSLRIKPDGKKLYILDATIGDLKQYSLGTAWDLTTMSYDSVNISFLGEEAIPRGLYFKNDGEQLFMSGSTNDKFYTYRINDSTPEGTTINSNDFNYSTFEMYTEGFVINVTSNLTDEISADLIWNGVRYTGNRSGNNSQMEFNVSIENAVGTTGDAIPFYWEFTHGSDTFNSSTEYQLVTESNISFCDPIYNVNYLNITFKDEETLVDLNSTMEVINWKYWVSNISNYKEVTLQETSEKPSQGFCFRDLFDKTINLTKTQFRYSATGYPQRIWSTGADLTNTTTNQLLYLLATADGQYTTITTQSSFGTPIEDVNIIVERQFSGIWTTIGDEDTDSSGSSTFWLNPDYDHRFTLSKSGYATQILTFRPTQTSYNIVMSGSQNVTELEYVPIGEGVSYAVAPSFLTILNQSTSYTFEFSVTANRSNLRLYLFNITDFDGNLLGSANGTTATGGDLSITLNTLVNKSFITRYFIETTGNVSGQVLKNEYKILNVNPSNFSLAKGFQNININNEDTDKQFGYFFYFFFILFMLVAGVTKLTGAEVSQPGTAQIVVASSVVVLSILNFFTISFSDNDFINQFGIAAACVLFIAGRIIGGRTR